MAVWSLTGSRPEAAAAEPGIYTKVSTPKTGEGAELAAWDGGGSEVAVKGIYLSAYSAGSANLEAYLKLLDRTELNAMVVDVKDVTGEVMYPSKVPLAKEIGATRNVIPDLKSLNKQLQDRDIYTIARVAVFEDDILPRQRPDLAVTDSSTGAPWLNNAGQSWANAYQREVWEYNTAVAKEAAEAGFDEIQFDYIRFPSDGPMDQLDYGKETFPTQEDAIAGFLEYAHGELEPMGVEVGADVFGLVGNTDEGGIGQVVSKMVPNLDVLSPMVYPSHYTPGSYGYPNPNAEPYGVIEASMKQFIRKSEKANPDVELRPWIQDFDLGAPDYGPAEVKAQLRATYDLGLTGWLLWNAGSEFTDGALAPDGAENIPNKPDTAQDKGDDGSGDTQYSKDAGEATR